MKKWTGGGGRPAQGVHGRCRSSQPPQDGAGLSNYTYSTQGRRRWRRRPQEEEEEEEEVQCSTTDQAEGGESLGEDSEIFAPSSNSVKSEGEKGEKLEKEGRGGGRKIRIWCI